VDHAEGVWQWPLVVRRVRDSDRDAVLAFASSTWHGWDYIPNAWSVWMDAPDGAFLTATVGEPGGVDASGEPLAVGQPVAITRVALAAPREAWMEGIRVDPRVRGMEVARDLQIAELAWVAAQDADVVRYATGHDNEASHRLGARDGINFLVAFHSLWWTEDPDNEPDDPSAYDGAVRAAATALRRKLLADLADERWIAAPGDIDRLWAVVEMDPGFAAGLRLYEPRAWALNELTRPAFVRHVERGEVIVTPGGDALAIIVNEQLPSEDSALRAAVLVGAPESQLELLEKVRSVAGVTVRLRVAANSPLRSEHLALFERAGYRSPEWKMHVLGRRMDLGTPLPEVRASRLVLAEAPDRLIPPRW